MAANAARTVGEVVARALRNYLAGDGDQLVADLAPGATVALPQHTLRMTAAG